MPSTNTFYTIRLCNTDQQIPSLLFIPSIAKLLSEKLFYLQSESNGCRAGLAQGQSQRQAPLLTAEEQTLAGFIMAADSGKYCSDIESTMASSSPRDVQETHERRSAKRKWLELQLLVS